MHPQTKTTTTKGLIGLMRTNLLRQSMVAAAFILAVASCKQEDRQTESTASNSSTSQEEMIKRGKYLVTVAGCNDCHSPKVMTEQGPEPDAARLLSGHPQAEQTAPIIQTNDWMLFNMGLTAFVGPWGMSYAANLTPDETGIGNWNFEQFERAIRQGKFKGLETGRPLLPPMPWQMYRNMTDEDLRSVFAYLKSLPPVNNVVPSPKGPQQIKELAAK